MTGSEWRWPSACGVTCAGGGRTGGLPIELRRKLEQRNDGHGGALGLRLTTGEHRGMPFSPKNAGEAFGVSDRQARRPLTRWEQAGAVEEQERYVLAVVAGSARIAETRTR